MTDSLSTYPDFTSDGKYKVIGTRPVRHDGLDKVTGRAIYGADVRIPGLLYGKVLRSPHAHARIISIDTTKAMQLEGVRAVATADDLVETVDKLSTFGESIVNIRELAKNSLASEKVLYKGHAVAAVAATQPAYRRRSARPDRGRIRTAARRCRCAGGHEGGCAPARREPHNQGFGGGHRKEKQHRLVQPQ